uniref:ZP domain-containing protein n=1 Tax=Astyanax mexicanus TaxID=7994 RepID=A0A8B9J735_ASTMX
MALLSCRAVLRVFLCCIQLGFIQYSTQEDLQVALDPNTGEYEWYSCESVGSSISSPPPGEPEAPSVLEDGLVENPAIPQYLVFCRRNAMAVVLPSGALSQVKVFGMTPLQEVPETCGYSLTRNHGRNIVHIRYTCCEVQDVTCTLRIVYQNRVGQTEIATASCRVSSSQPPSPISPTPGPQDPGVIFPGVSPPHRPGVSPPHRPGVSPHLQPIISPSPTPGEPLLPSSIISPSPTPGEPLLPSSATVLSSSAIPWPLQQQGCLSNGKFVFAIPANIMEPPLNPASLTVVGHGECKPAFVNKDIAVFNFLITECGTRTYRIGKTTIYMVEVQMPIRTLNFQYGIITRDHPVRVIVECRYSEISHHDPGQPATGWTTAKYMVMSTNLPDLVRAKGLFGVELRIAEDKTFSTFLPHDHQPLRVLLGKPVYLEVRLKSLKPEATLLVHYCIAYPRSAKSALVLVYEGCPNPLDADNISILHMADLPQNRHKRRFEVKAFQFMDQCTNNYLNEEIYFMCSTEVCMPSETPCRETCFDVKSPSTAADVQKPQPPLVGSFQSRDFSFLDDLSSLKVADAQ